MATTGDVNATRAGVGGEAAELEVTAPTVGPLAGDPTVIGVPLFIVGSIALGLTLIGFVPAGNFGAVAVIICATWVGQVIAAVWAAALGQNAVACVFGIFAGFWLSYSLLAVGILHSWWGIVPAADAASATASTGDVNRSVVLFLICWLALIVMLTVVTLRFPLAFTALLVVVDAALALALAGYLKGASSGLLAIAGYLVFTFAAIGVYLFANSLSLALGGKGLELGKPLIAAG
ncbi:GPR1/FUN34/YaaH family transporter [Pseudonocardia acidicola]|uniref:GPR1/FUN34/yaaH family protein n=1 Tax=Pseudonocardia acidicola TaxID=2724939 RepID=A0ABX1S5T4_9PSEU|nr:GPR1/FUN34/YaaH family transporter [Pseudonocardia acidicola]NMH96940.1 hypothetical protein [Pseudonocardia acidicola]